VLDQENALVPLFRASSPADRVSGASVRAAVESMGHMRQLALRTLAAHGIAEPSPTEWYPWQKYLDALRALMERTGPNTLAMIGRQLVAGHTFPPSIRSLEDVLVGLDADYQTRHRGRDIGEFRFEPVRPGEARLTIRNPYPCELDRGVIMEMGRRFKRPDGTSARIRHVAAERCRAKGAEACEYLIEG
jgi:hypothetical protein